nr:hypothetical protein [Bordetella bronchialis]
MPEHAHIPDRRRRAAFLAGPLVALVLAGCADMAARTPPDTPLSQVVAQYGQPNFTCPLPNGGQRVIWTQQPLGQFAWGGNVGPDGRIDKVERLLTDRHFAVLSQGDWPANRVLCEFGPPAIVDEVGLPSVRQVVWSYRYRENDSWNSLMYVYMGRKGDRVTRHHPGPDPMYDQEWDFAR